jgi:hypothetical protein
MQQEDNNNMAEEIPTPEPNLSELEADLNATLSTPGYGLSDTLPAKPEAIDIYKNNVGNPITGSEPQGKLATFSSKDYAAALGNATLQQTSIAEEDPYIKMRPFTYSGDYDAANFDRYYGTKAYKTLGFSPYRDNDALYNQKMTFGDQFVRAAGQWDNLMATGFMSGVKSWGTMFTDPLAPDLDSARDMKRSMAIGNISTGGVGAFVGNTFLNSAYSIGIGLEFLAEEAALAAATAFTGGMAGEVTLPAMAARGGFFARQLGKIGEMGAKVGGNTERFAKAAEVAGQFAKNLKKAPSGLDDMSSARQFFSKVANGTFDLINPLESTAGALKSQRYANDLAKTVGTAGAFMDDIIRIKTAASEAQLEGGMVKIDATERLIDQYREMNGKDPEGDDLKKIEDLASIEARRTTLYNFPAIMTTNKLLFSTILYPLKKTLGTANARMLEDVVAEDGMKALAKDPFSVIGRGTKAQMKAAAKSLAKPALYGQYGMAYLKANVAEGLQENIQEAISAGAINHALAVQKDPGMAAYRGYMGYLMDGLKEQVSAQGAETFASGFLMGMFTQPIMTAPSWAVSKGIEKFKNKEARDKAKAERDEALKKEADTLNEMANNDINYWAPDLGTAVKNGALSNDLMSAASIGDEKASKDAKFRIEFNHIETAINSGKFEDLMTKLADYKNLTPEEAFEAFQRYGIGINTKEEAIQALEKIDGVIERARSIKDKYQAVAQDFPNPFNPSGLKPGTDDYNAVVDSHMAWREAQKNLVFATAEFENYSTRLAQMTDAFSNLASPIAKADTQRLLSTMNMVSLKKEIATLKQELKGLNQVEAPASERKEKEKNLELLEKFYDAITVAQETIKKENLTDKVEKQVVYQDAKEAYQKYLGHIAKKNDSILFNKTTDKAFDLLTDTLEMKSEQYNLAKTINVLNNPNGFLKLQKRLQEAFNQERLEKQERILENLEAFLTTKDENQIIQTLGKLGVKIPEDFLAEYKDALKNKKPLPSPEYYINPATQEKITKETGGQEFEKAAELWDAFRAWMHLTNDIKDTAEIEKWASLIDSATSEKELDSIMDQLDKAGAMTPDFLTDISKKRELLQKGGEEAIIKAFNDYNPGLKDRLTQMYHQAKVDGKIKESTSLAQFLATDPDAIIQIRSAESVEKLVDKPVVTPEPVKKEPIKGYTQQMPGGRTVTFNPDLRTWEFRNRSGKLITNKKTVEKLVDDLSRMPGIVKTWWTRFLTDAERDNVRAAFEDYANKARAGMEAKGPEGFAPTLEFMLLEALQGAKFDINSDVATNVTDAGGAWFGAKGYKSVDAFVNSGLADIYSAYGMQLPDDTQDLINDVYNIINEYPAGIKDKDLKSYKERVNPNEELLDLKKDFAKEHGLDIEKAYFKIESENLLNYSEAPPADVDVTVPPEEVTLVPEKDWKPITNASALKKGDVLIDKAGKEYVFIGYDPGYEPSFSPDDNVTFPGEPESISTKDREGKTVDFYGPQILTLAMKPFAKREVVATEVLPVEQAVKTVNKDYEGKVIFITPGSGKTDLAKNNEDVIDADNLLLEAIQELNPIYPISDQLSAAQNIYDAIRYAGIDKKKLYTIGAQKIKEMAAKGKTVITSSVALMKHADIIMNQTNPEFIIEKYDRNKELTADTGDALVIGIYQDIQDAIKKSPAELLGTITAQEVTEVPEITIEDINKNLTADNLALAQERGYDAIYKNERYAITKVEQNSVSLKALDGSTQTVAPSEITAVTEKENVVITSEENKDFKDNSKKLETGAFDVDFDADNLDDAANAIRKNIC